MPETPLPLESPEIELSAIRELNERVTSKCDMIFQRKGDPTDKEKTTRGVPSVYFSAVRDPAGRLVAEFREFNDFKTPPEYPLSLAHDEIIPDPPTSVIIFDPQTERIISGGEIKPEYGKLIKKLSEKICSKLPVHQ